MAECLPGTPAVQRVENHHDLVANGLMLAVSQDSVVGGGLGRPSSLRRRAYERLKPYATEQMKTLFRDDESGSARWTIVPAPPCWKPQDLLNRLTQRRQRPRIG